MGFFAVYPGFFTRHELVVFFGLIGSQGRLVGAFALVAKLLMLLFLGSSEGLRFRFILVVGFFERSFLVGRQVQFLCEGLVVGGIMGCVAFMGVCLLFFVLHVRLGIQRKRGEQGKAGKGN